MTCRIARIVSILNIVLVVASVAQAGTFTTGTFSTPTDVKQGPFVLAENTGSASSVTVGTGVFGPETFFTGSNQFTGGGDTFADSNLNQLMSDGRYGVSMSASLPVVSGHQYQLELLFWDPVSGYVPGSRPINITAGSDTLTGFDVIGTTVGWKGNEGAKVDYSFVATGNTLALNLSGVPTAQDGNAFLNGFSLTAVPEPSSMILCGLGALGLFITAHRRRKA